MNKLQAQINLDLDTKAVLDYWQSEYGVAPDAWELSSELEVSEKVAQTQLDRHSKSQAEGEKVSNKS